MPYYYNNRLIAKRIMDLPNIDFAYQNPLFQYNPHSNGGLNAALIAKRRVDLANLNALLFPWLSTSGKFSVPLCVVLASKAVILK